MDITITVPDTLVAAVQAWLGTQLTANGQFQRYADIQDLFQQNANAGLLSFFVGLFEAAPIAALQAQITADQSAVSLPAPKPPIPASGK